MRFLHVVSRWQLGTPGLDRDPLSPWYGEASAYEVVAPGRGTLQLHPSRVVRFLGNPWPDPSVAPTPWSDPVLQALYDAVHAVALTVAGATSLGDALGITNMPVVPSSALLGEGHSHGDDQPRDWHGRWTTEESEGLHAPDGAQVEQIGFGKRHDKRRGRMPALGKGAILGGVGRFLRRLWPEGSEPDEPNAPSATQAPESSPTPPLIKPDPRAAQKLDDALSDYQTRRYTVDHQTFQLDKAGMRDILERHSPEYWDGVPKGTQTFFPEGTTAEQLQDVVGDVLNQNRDMIIAEPSQYGWRLNGTSGGVRYDVGIYQGRINHLVPLK